MNTLQAISSRKSIRSFCGDVSDENLAIILKAAYAAPVGLAKYENLHLTVIRNRELMAKIDTAAAQMFGNPALKPLYGAPMFILVSAKLSSPEDNVGYSNCAGIVENMALAATELGLGACHIWGAVMAMKQNPNLVNELHLPDGFTPCCGIILGQTDVAYAEREIPEGRIATDYI